MARLHIRITRKRLPTGGSYWLVTCSACRERVYCWESAADAKAARAEHRDAHYFLWGLGR